MKILFFGCGGEEPDAEGGGDDKGDSACGHVGYSVRPTERRKGYGTKMLDLVLKKAYALGIEKALVTCDDNNIGSARVIEKNGGILADKIIKCDSKVLLRRYWIDLT